MESGDHGLPGGELCQERGEGVERERGHGVFVAPHGVGKVGDGPGDAKGVDGSDDGKMVGVGLCSLEGGDDGVVEGGGGVAAARTVERG